MRRRLLILLFVSIAIDRALAAPPRVNDIVHTVQARKLIYDDPELSKLNLGIIVEDRVAILWGPVPSLDLGLRAESRLRDMIELRDVRNELFVNEVTPEFLPIRVPARPSPGMPVDFEPRPKRPPVPVQLGDPRPQTTSVAPLPRHAL